ncbi:unnamed protein product [Kuraishia capsulata CBS 1993]|uniref:HTH La-type RNA-binding domain-containing protein n=1 Tax=Kuraishia capsulata CBS 1993 TaxID=1382522 RepID=W6MGC9_9ASCO|nr:uncharacterized protein KUCA_T00000498001 [Kuraishia capsulata CBS 1993]CDK24533.1 unnamed protein product [Kuraishia capsulata CBS 1993]
MSEATTPLNKLTTLLPAPPPDVNPWSQRPVVKPVAQAPTKKEQWPAPDQSSKENIKEIAKDSNVSPAVVKRGKEKWVPLKANIAIAAPSKNSKSKANKSKKSGNGSAVSNGPANQNNVEGNGNNNGAKSATNGEQKKKSKSKSKSGKPKEEAVGEKSEPTAEVPDVVSVQKAEDGASITSAIKDIAVAAEEVVEADGKVGQSLQQEQEKEVNSGQDRSSESGPEAPLPQSHPQTPLPEQFSESNDPNAVFLQRNGSRRSFRNPNDGNASYGNQRHHGFRHSNGNFRRNSQSPNYGMPIIPQPYIGGMMSGSPFIPMNPYMGGGGFQYPQFVPPFPIPETKKGSKSNNESTSSASSAGSPISEAVGIAQQQPYGMPPMNYVDPSVYMNPYGGNPYVQMYPASQPYLDDRVSQLGQQINYYFSIENLLKDLYLRKHMNSNGFVAVQFIEDFARVRHLANGDHNLVVQAIRQNPQLELVGTGKEKKVRRKESWENWILPKDQRDPSVKDD